MIRLFSRWLCSVRVAERRRVVGVGPGGFFDDPDVAGTLDAEEVTLCDDPQIGIAGDLPGPLAGALGQVPRGQGLQPPGDAPEQVLAVAADFVVFSRPFL